MARKGQIAWPARLSYFHTQTGNIKRSCVSLSRNSTHSRDLAEEVQRGGGGGAQVI